MANEKQPSPTCHVDGCERDGELVVKLPDMDEAQVVCRRYLRRIHPEVDAKTWLETGYAAWRISGAEDVPTPIEELRTGDRIRKREILDESFGWSK